MIDAFLIIITPFEKTELTGKIFIPLGNLKIEIELVFILTKEIN